MIEWISNLSGFWAMLGLILGFGFIIFVHELGHFLAAKSVGIKVEKFAVGFDFFGLKIASFTKGETEYLIGLIPLGGYVKMLGQEDMDPNALSEDPRAYNNKSASAKLLVLSAGVIMNAIFAIIFFIIAFMSGVDFPPSIVGGTLEDSPAAVAAAVEDPALIGLKPGDKIVKINDEPVSEFMEVKLASALAAEKEELTYTIERPDPKGGEPRTLNFKLTPESTSKLMTVGVAPPRATKLVSKAILSDSDRKKFESLGGVYEANIVKLNGTPIQHYWQIDHIINNTNSKALAVTLKDKKGKEHNLDLTFQSEFQYQKPDKDQTGQRAQAHLLGLQPGVQVSATVPKSPADGKLQPGDVIKSIAGVTWPTQNEFIDTIAKNKTSDIKFTVMRGDEIKELTIKPRAGKIGVAFRSADATYIAGTLKDTPFAIHKFPKGTKIEKINGTPIKSFTDLRITLQNLKTPNFKITVSEPIAGATQRTLDMLVQDNARNALAELAWDHELFGYLTMLKVTQKADGPAHAVALGVEKTHVFMVNTYLTLLRLIQGTISPSELRGPVGIVNEGSKIAQQGWAYLMFFLGLISINLAVINFLPLPIVDGGHAVLVIVEKLRGKPLSPQFQTAILLLGLVMIGSLFLYVTFNDIARIVLGA